MTAMDLRGSTIIVNGHTCEGWSQDGDCFGPPQDHELERVITGADGLSASFGTGMKGGEFNYKFMPNSPSYFHFNKLAQQKLRGDNNNAQRVLEGSADFPFVSVKSTMKGGRLIKAPLAFQAGQGEFAAGTFVIYWEECLTEGGKTTSSPTSPPGGIPITP